MPRTSDPFSILRTVDRKRLLMAEAGQLLGLVMELNRTPRYHNRLDALQLVYLVGQYRSHKRRRNHA